jgi:hypothetical protein
MRLGILIIGSLYWDPSSVRCRWRQNRLSCSETRQVKAPIRYGKKTKKRGRTYTMVFSKSCSGPATLGTALVVPTRADCCEPEHLFEEAQHLWAAERDEETISGISEDWGKVCVLRSPQIDPNDRILMAWRKTVSELGDSYGSLPAAADEDPVLDAASGLALFNWPTDVATNAGLAGFDLLLMTANKPTLVGGQYATAIEVATAWRDDTESHVMYFYNNRRYGITTFEDTRIQSILRGDPQAAAPVPEGQNA